MKTEVKEKIKTACVFSIRVNLLKNWYKRFSISWIISTIWKCDGFWWYENNNKHLCYQIVEWNNCNNILFIRTLVSLSATGILGLPSDLHKPSTRR